MTDLISPVISVEECSLLDVIPSLEEIFDSLCSMGSNKAPGPDGLPVLFYKEYWHIISRDVIATVQDFFKGENVLPSLNYTFIVLIPKVTNPQLVTQFRLISLCNVFYKIISKIIATHLKKFLPRMIYENQSAFVPGRLIQDNSILAHEICHALNSRRGLRG